MNQLYKIEVNARRKQKIDTRATLLSRRKLYWPFDRVPRSRLFAYAIACLEVMLKCSDDARHAYSTITEAWSLPGCQELLQEAFAHAPDTNAWIKEIVEAIRDNLPSPEYEVRDIMAEKLQANKDFQQLLTYVSVFVLKSFNRKIDLLNNQPKVLAENSESLTSAIVLRSLLDHCEVDLIVLNRYHRDYDGLMSINPTTRKERLLKQKIVQAFKHEGWRLCDNQTILDGAEMWYRARVLSNLLREAADYYSIDPIDLSKRVQIYDDATGWPRSK